MSRFISLTHRDLCYKYDALCWELNKLQKMATLVTLLLAYGYPNCLHRVAVFFQTLSIGTYHQTRVVTRK